MTDKNIGVRFGRLVVIQRMPNNPKSHSSRYLCQCDCENTTVAYLTNVKRGLTQSCGCLHKEVAAARLLTHGKSKTRLHSIWCGMRRRCEKYNPNSHDSKKYIEKGIRVCDEWKNDFTAFYNWAVKNGYSDDLSIDRIDNNGDYCPKNCRWATAETQANNRSTNSIISFHGEEKTVSQWARQIGVSPSSLANSYRAGRAAEYIGRRYRREEAIANEE